MQTLHLTALGGIALKHCCKNPTFLSFVASSPHVLLSSWGHAHLHHSTVAASAAAAHQGQTLHANALISHYKELVQSNSLKPDVQQRACIVQLSALCDQLQAYSHRVDEFEAQSDKYQASLLKMLIILDPDCTV